MPPFVFSVLFLPSFHVLNGYFLKKIVICLVPTKHLGVPITSFKRVRAFQIELEFRSAGFFGGEGKTGVPGYFHLSVSFVAVLFEF